jgi:hypothetical protein
VKSYVPGDEKASVVEQLRDTAREYLRFSASGQDLIQPRLSEQGFTDVSFGGGALKGRPLLSGWVTVDIRTSQLSLVEQGRTSEVDDIYLALKERGLKAVAYVHLTNDTTTLSGWENLPLAEEMSPTEKLRWLHSGMFADLEGWIEANADNDAPSRSQE